MTYADEAIAFNFKIATLAQTASLAMTGRVCFVIARRQCLFADEAIAFNFEIATLAQTASLAMTGK